LSALWRGVFVAGGGMASSHNSTTARPALLAPRPLPLLQPRYLMNDGLRPDILGCDLPTISHRHANCLRRPVPGRVSIVTNGLQCMPKIRTRRLAAHLRRVVGSSTNGPQAEQRP
jgi:hypothetical protein